MSSEVLAFEKTERGHRLVAEVELPAPREQVFDFFSQAGNLEKLTPNYLQFRLLTPEPAEMREGQLIDYRLRLRGIPLRWRSKISVWEPPCRFVDEQVIGPYRFWRHEHQFEECSGGTRVRDVVDYAVPLGWLAHPLFVKPDLRRIFGFRSRTIREYFPGA